MFIKKIFSFSVYASIGYSIIFLFILMEFYFSVNKLVALLFILVVCLCLWYLVFRTKTIKSEQSDIVLSESTVLTWLFFVFGITLYMFGAFMIHAVSSSGSDVDKKLFFIYECLGFGLFLINVSSLMIGYFFNKR